MRRRASRLRRLALAVWLVLLAASHATWFVRSRSAPPPPGPSVELPEFRGATPTGRRVRVAYADHPGDERTPVVLLHGSPGGFDDFRGLLPRLDGRRAIVPDLPGFGRSGRDVADYSIRAHAAYLRALLDELAVESAHLVGYSMGGGVALELERQAPDRVRSITLLSSIGVVELELFGLHELNHAVHAVQLAGLTAARWLLPHFGTFDANPLNVAYARNFHDTDQRPLRAVLEAYEEPLLVLHGVDDFLVPVEAAREHARIVPQARAEWLAEGHFLLMQRPEVLAGPLVDFLADVDAGTARTRDDATPAELARAALPFDPADVPPFSGPALLTALIALAAATLVSEDLTCALAGFLVAQGRLSFLAATGACFTGILAGDLGLFLLGRTFGRPLVRRAPFRWVLKEADLTRASRWFQRRGLSVVLLSRFLPGLRLPTYVAAGVLRTRFLSFTLHFALACAVWTPLLVGASAWAGREASYVAFLREHPWRALLAVVAFLFVLQRLVVPACTHAGRRRLVGAWRRRRHWEFWPPWAFYPPILAYVAWLTCKHRSLAVLTAVNPAIPLGGFVGESKSEILAGLGDSPRVARWIVLRAGDDVGTRVATARAFALEVGLPVVLKPDVGQRGSGVVVVREHERLDELVEVAAVDVVLQQFVPGPEYGLFYVRHPDEPTGRLFSITEKVLPTVTGDGERTLERLILDDERAVCVATTYFEANADRLYDVPAAGEEVRLVDLGTHVRGALFRDGAHLGTAELTAAVDELSRGYDGFFFGRYDVRVPSEADLVAGRGFRVLELNGMTSEATHVYDRKHSLLEAYRVLFRQWRLAFEIAAANRDRGARVDSLADAARAWWAYRRLQAHHGWERVVRGDDDRDA